MIKEKSITPLMPLAAPIYDGERFEPFEDEYGILQRRDCYRFGSDAVSLAKFACRFVDAKSSVFDLCSGGGVIGMTIAIMTNAKVCGAEIDKTLHDMSVRSCLLNGLNDVKFYNADITDLNNEIFTPHVYDAVVCNPPYYKASSLKRNLAPTANSEITVRLSQVITAARHLLKQGGAFFVTHVTSRLDEVICECNALGLAVKEVVIRKNCKTFMLRAVFGGKQGVTVRIE